tara:strand:- start:1 stop:255 length:255 start_codon:yes stop_codon:yes gene_type:complete
MANPIVKLLGFLVTLAILTGIIAAIITYVPSINKNTSLQKVPYMIKVLKLLKKAPGSTIEDIPEDSTEPEAETSTDTTADATPV